MHMVDLFDKSVMQASISSKTILPPGQTDGIQLEGGKNPPPGKIIVYKNSSPQDKTGGQKPHPRDIKLENLTNISIKSHTI